VEDEVLFASWILLDDEPFGYGRLSERRLRKQFARGDQGCTDSRSP